ncbi:MAG: response regulator [Bacteroidota bacterium]
MSGKKVTFSILAAFITGTFILVYMEYNSTKNVTALMTGNDKLMAEFNVNVKLYDLRKNITTVESKIRGFVTTRDTANIEGLDSNITETEADLNQLKKLSDDNSSILYIDKLGELVQEELRFSHQVLDTFNYTGETAAEKLVATQHGKKLTDSIAQLIHLIDTSRKKHLASATVSINKSGEKALRFSYMLIIVVLVAAGMLFWYIIHIIQKLIQSEKKVKEVAGIKENFMANMSHEIRTPMNAILGFTALLQRQSLNDKSKEYVSTIQKSGENLLAIINDILDLSKIEAGMMQIESAPFSVRGLLHSVEMMFKSKAEEKGLQIYADIGEAVPDILEGDATRLTQILVNLIGNALKFTKKGSISIKISNRGKINNEIRLGITIGDTGIGIEKDKQEKIFERFQQAEESVTRNYGGTGLGLSIVNELVYLQKGTIHVESEAGTGTTFLIVIPYKISDEQQLDDTFLPSNDLNLQSDFNNIRILVAEDNEINQSLIKHLFGEWGLAHDLAQNGKVAIAMLKQRKYDLVLMDIQMPEMDGYTAAQEIRETLQSDIPIIAMTAHALAGEKEKCLSYGMNDYISKPIREAKLHQLITEFTNIPIVDVATAKPSVVPGEYQYINLKYMKEISSGNVQYEKTVTEQFIEAIPEDLQMLEKKWADNHISELKQLAHNMKTTISVMGLNETLQPYLDVIEYEEFTEETFRYNFSAIKVISETAVEEAKHFYKTL